jgi:hypothetical protein
MNKKGKQLYGVQNEQKGKQLYGVQIDKRASNFMIQTEFGLN